jgi:hypothetical protein
MKKNVILSAVILFTLMLNTLVCHAAKWDKNTYADTLIESGYYDAKSIKVKGKVVSWTEKYLLTNEGVTFTAAELSKHEVCKENIEKLGAVSQFQIDYQIKKNNFHGTAKRYYTKDNKLLCTNKDTGDNFKTDWKKIERGSPMMDAQYDLVTKYKVKFPN